MTENYPASLPDSHPARPATWVLPRPNPAVARSAMIAASPPTDSADCRRLRREQC